jgi:hypothetical protein
MITAFVALGGYEVQKFFLQGTAIQHYEPHLSRPFGFSFRHLVEYIQSAPDWRGKSNLFIFVKEETRLSEELTTGHVVEAFDYLFPTFRVTVVPSELVGHYSLYISPTAQLPAHFEWEEVQFCSDTNSLGPSTEFQRFFACNEPFFPVYQMKAMESRFY